MKDKAINLNLQEPYKIIAISDIHAHLQVFNAMLESLDLQEDHILILMGDFINKGPNSLKSVRRMMELSTRPNTYILKGNHEYFIAKYLYSFRPNSDKFFSDDKFLDYLKQDYFDSLIHDVCRHGHFDLKACQSFIDLRTWIFDRYKAEFDFIHKLPILVEADDMIFVHGGYDKSIDIRKEEGKFLKYDDFNRLSHVQDKTVIVGHWPSSNLRTDTNTNRPFFNHKKNIITIDGGLGVKTSGELNALIIEKEKANKTFHYLQENHFEEKTIIRQHVFHQEDKYFVNFPHFELELIEQGDLMSKCRHIHSGKVISILNDLLTFKNGKPEVKVTYINNHLNLTVGDKVELVKTYDKCAHVKYKGEFGWVFADQLN